MLGPIMEGRFKLNTEIWVIRLRKIDGTVLVGLALFLGVWIVVPSAWSQEITSADLAFAAQTVISRPPSLAEGGASMTVVGEGASQPVAGTSPSNGADDFISRWLAMATLTQNKQPHWMTPLVTVTPRLEQEVRYDQFLGNVHGGGSLENYGGGKGLEIIPSERTEVILGIPPYERRSNVPKKENAEGFGDWPVFLFKYRFLSANEKEGNYILTAFFQLSAPTGTAAFSNNAYLLQPTLAAGKGWGVFDVQATFSQQYSIASNSAGNSFGDPFLVNVATQAHFFEYFWPEFEVNYTYWPNGEKKGHSQVYLTPGIILGRFPIYHRVKAIIGTGCQFATSPHPALDSNVLITARLTF